MSRAVLGLGTNLGDRGRNLAAAVEALGRLPETAVARVSSVWQTAPFDVPDEQQDYWNICVLLETGLSPRALLGACLGIEAALGRVRRTYHGARTIDLDLLLYEGAACALRLINAHDIKTCGDLMVVFRRAAFDETTTEGR